MRPSFSNIPPWYRSLVKLLHWTIFGLIITALIVGNVTVVKWGYIGSMSLWILGYGAFGLLAKPGPALKGALRNYFVPLHIFMMGMPAIFAVALLNADPGPLSGPARSMALATLAAGSLHGIFHLWRHTALGDGALRNMTPRFLHGLL